MSLYDKIVRPTTQMLLKRMEDHPDDFDISLNAVLGSRSWLSVAKHGEFNWYERRLINKKVKANRRKETEQRILELLLDGQPKQEELDLESYNHITTPTTFGMAQIKPEGKRVVYSASDLRAIREVDPVKWAKIKRAYDEYTKQPKL